MIGWKYTKVEDADDEVKELAQEMKAATEAKLRATFSQFEAVKFKKQYVMGTNYFIKVKVGHEQFVHIQVYKNARVNGGGEELSKTEGGNTLADQL